MGWFARTFGLGGSVAWDGVAGTPRSANGASSHHLIWDVPAGRWSAVDVVVEIVEPPTVAALYFWALQVSFAGPGSGGGGAHLGLQWFDRHPGSTAVNWGGYGPAGGELDGSPSTLPSTPGNANTRDYPWVAGRAYRLRVAHAGSADAARSAWRGSITDLARDERTEIRDLWAAGDHLASPMVWSEVFADCSAPPTTVRWSDLTVEDLAGVRAPVRRARVNYQSVADGGCVTSTSTPGSEPGSFEQRTGTARTTGQDAILDAG